MSETVEKEESDIQRDRIVRVFAYCAWMFAGIYFAFVSKNASLFEVGPRTLNTALRFGFATVVVPGFNFAFFYALLPFVGKRLEVLRTNV